MTALPEGTVTFLFTDVVGSTELVRRHGAAYSELLGRARSLLRSAFAAHGGVEVDTQGDAFFVAFERARDGVLAAADIQRALAAHDWPPDGVIRVRIGLHTAEPHRWNEGYVGVGVHRAARICAVGHGGQILLSRSTAGLIDDEQLDGLSLRDLGAHRLKGLQAAERVFQLVVAGLPGEFAPLDTLEGAGTQTETATVLVGDVDGFTRLARELPPDRFRALVADVSVTLQTALEALDARGVAVDGDGVIGTFRSARSALDAAIGLKGVVEARTWPGGRPLSIKIALHSGEVVATAYGPFGITTNLAVELCGRARRTGMLVSEATRQLLDAEERLLLEDEGVEELRFGSVHVYGLARPIPDAAAARAAESVRMS